MEKDLDGLLVEDFLLRFVEFFCDVEKKLFVMGFLGFCEVLEVLFVRQVQKL